MTWWHGLCNAQKLPSAWDNFINIFKKQFLQPSYETEATQNLPFLVVNFILLKIIFILLRPNSKNGISKDNKWFIAFLLHGISNSDYLWIVYDQDPTDLWETIDILLRYGCTSKNNHNKTLASTPNPS